MSDSQWNGCFSLEIYLPKSKPIVILYRDYKSFRSEVFRTDLDTELTKYDFYKMECQQFFNIKIQVLRKHIPMKNKYIRANQRGFRNENLRKIILKRSRLRNIFLKLKTEKSTKVYNTQRNYCVSLLRKAKRILLIWVQ